jgi:hypothetical protein
MKRLRTNRVDSRTTGGSPVATSALERLFTLQTELDALEAQARVMQLDIPAVLIGAAAEAIKDEMERLYAAPIAVVGTA